LVAPKWTIAYDLNVMGSDLICYQFSRSKAERGDFTHFLSLYGQDKLPSGRRLREMMGSMVFLVDGYDLDPREIHAIPEMRRFYSAFHEAWPYWLYFCDLNQDGLKTMIFCCLKSFTTLQVDGQPTGVTETDPLELVRFIGKDFLSMNAICERAEMFEHLIYERTKQVFLYFGLPFDSEPDPTWPSAR